MKLFRYDKQERDETLLEYIAQSIALILRYTAGGQQSFLSDPMVQDAVLRRLETLADAARHLSPALTARHSDIPWCAIFGFRNVAAHGYLTLDPSRIWLVVQDFLPALQSVVVEELQSLRRDP